MAPRESRLLEETFAACIALGRSYGFEEGHSLQDGRLAARIFDLTTDLHQLDLEFRDLLYCAALLHDIGYISGYLGHHKTAYKLILGARLPGLTQRQQLLVANIARYHRGARPSLAHQGFAALDEKEREMVLKLGAILRLADGLDRSHTDAVQQLDARVERGRVTILVECPLGCALEVWAAQKKGRLLGEVLGVEVEVRQLSS